MIHFEIEDPERDTLEVEYDGGEYVNITNTYPEYDQAVAIFLDKSQVIKLKHVLDDVIKQMILEEKE
ncbi:MAG: hypothetical protein HRU26_08970 [Psychroserpens sp.]|nr:hypothetical protein [Psychroserpens sp.]